MFVALPTGAQGKLSSTSWSLTVMVVVEHEPKVKDMYRSKTSMRNQTQFAGLCFALWLFCLTPNANHL